MRSFLLRPAAALLCAAALSAQPEKPAKATAASPAPAAPLHVRALWLQDPAHEVVISWSTRAPAPAARVLWDRAPGPGNGAPYAREAKPERSGRYSGSPELYYHHARIVGLEPSTTYRFVVESGGVRSGELRFTTAPTDERSFTLIFNADSRSDPRARRAVNRRIAALAADPEVTAMILGGDYVMNGRSLRQWIAWLDDQEVTTTRDGRTLPLIPVRGNHEARGKLYDELFCWPGGGYGKNRYALRLGAHVLLVVLNTEAPAGGEQAAFLERTLRAHRSVRWQVAAYHRPFWPAVKRPCRAKRHWLPIFEDFRLDLALEADGHVIKRTVPIRNGMQDPRGVVYIGEGGGGVPPRTPKKDRWFLQPPGKAGRGHHVWTLRFTREELRLRAVLVDGKVFDEHRILPKPGR